MKNNHTDDQLKKIKPPRRCMDTKLKNQPLTTKTSSNRSFNETKIWLLSYREQLTPHKDVPKKQPRIRALLQDVETYLKNSTLHGLPYVGNNNLPFIDRFIWLIAFVVAFIFAVYFIILVYIKYSNNPIIITMNPTPTPVEDVPFPAVTICNMNEAMKSESQLIMLNGTASEKSFLEDICEFNDSLKSSSVVDEKTGNWDSVLKFMWKVSQPCDKMLKICKWRSKEIECSQIFSPILTDVGLCCTFNMLPLSYILRDPGNLVDYNKVAERYSDDIDDWNPERGYAPNSTYNVFPFRSFGSGTDLGLNLVLDADVNDYYCSSSSSAGFKVLLHNPLEIPKMEGSSFMLPSGLEIRMVFKPEINDATDTLKFVEMTKRNCYFIDEKYLKFYRVYTAANCKLECKANITLKKCGCVPFYLPRSDSTKICGKLQQECVDNVQETMDMTQAPIKEEKDCRCSSSCFQLNYGKSMSYGKLSSAFTVKEDTIRNESQEYFIKNMVVVHIYFVSTQFNRYTTSEIYGFSDFLSNTGGILGLFLGFSVLSIVELLYHSTLKLLCNTIRSKSSHHNTRPKITEVKQKR